MKRARRRGRAGAATRGSAADCSPPSPGPTPSRLWPRASLRSSVTCFVKSFACARSIAREGPRRNVASSWRAAHCTVRAAACCTACFAWRVRPSAARAIRPRSRDWSVRTALSCLRKRRVASHRRAAACSVVAAMCDMRTDTRARSPRAAACMARAAPRARQRLARATCRRSALCTIVAAWSAMPAFGRPRSARSTSFCTNRRRASLEASASRDCKRDCNTAICCLAAINSCCSRSIDASPPSGGLGTRPGTRGSGIGATTPRDGHAAGRG